MTQVWTLDCDGISRMCCKMNSLHGAPKISADSMLKKGLFAISKRLRGHSRRRSVHDVTSVLADIYLVTRISWRSSSWLRKQMG
jgi:hypothetical protein